MSTFSNAVSICLAVFSCSVSEFKDFAYSIVSVLEIFADKFSVLILLTVISPLLLFISELPVTFPVIISIFLPFFVKYSPLLFVTVTIPFTSAFVAFKFALISEYILDSFVITTLFAIEFPLFINVPSF